jgi:hypothetical protein
MAFEVSVFRSLSTFNFSDVAGPLRPSITAVVIEFNALGPSAGAARALMSLCLASAAGLFLTASSFYVWRLETAHVGHRYGACSSRANSPGGTFLAPPASRTSRRRSRVTRERWSVVCILPTGDGRVVLRMAAVENGHLLVANQRPLTAGRRPKTPRVCEKRSVAPLPRRLLSLR